MTSQTFSAAATPDHGLRPGRPPGLAVTNVRAAGHDLANMTVGLPPDGRIGTAEVHRLLRHHGVLTDKPTSLAAGPDPMPWACIWTADDRLIAIPAATAADAELLCIWLQKAGAKARVAPLISPAEADEVAASIRIAVDAAQAAAKQLYETQRLLGRLTESLTPTGSAHERAATTNPPQQTAAPDHTRPGD